MHKLYKRNMDYAEYLLLRVWNFGMCWAEDAYMTSLSKNLGHCVSDECP